MVHDVQKDTPVQPQKRRLLLIVLTLMFMLVLFLVGDIYIALHSRPDCSHVVFNSAGMNVNPSTHSRPTRWHRILHLTPAKCNTAEMAAESRRATGPGAAEMAASLAVPLRTASGTLTSGGASLGTTIRGIFKEHSLTAADIYKLDFSLPGDSSYGDDPRYEVLNPDGNNNRPLSPDVIATLSDHPQHTGFLFTIANRVQNFGTDETDLIAVFPHVKPEICAHVMRHAGSDSSTDDEQKIDLMPFPGVGAAPPTIVLPLRFANTANGCIRVRDGLYYVHTLYQR